MRTDVASGDDKPAARSGLCMLTQARRSQHRPPLLWRARRRCRLSCFPPSRRWLSVIKSGSCGCSETSAQQHLGLLCMQGGLGRIMPPHAGPEPRRCAASRAHSCLCPPRFQCSSWDGQGPGIQAKDWLLRGLQRQRSGPAAHAFIQHTRPATSPHLSTLNPPGRRGRSRPPPCTLSAFRPRKRAARRRCTGLQPPQRGFWPTRPRPPPPAGRHRGAGCDRIPQRLRFFLQIRHAVGGQGKREGERGAWGRESQTASETGRGQGSGCASAPSNRCCRQRSCRTHIRQRPQQAGRT